MGCLIELEAVLEAAATTRQHRDTECRARPAAGTVSGVRAAGRSGRPNCSMVGKGRARGAELEPPCARGKAGCQDALQRPCALCRARRLLAWPAASGAGGADPLAV